MDVNLTERTVDIQDQFCPILCYKSALWTLASLGRKGFRPEILEKAAVKTSTDFLAVC